MNAIQKNSVSITGKTQVFGVIGDPIEHTLSPMIHNRLYESMGRHSVYVPFLVSREALGDAVAGAYALGIRGLNVTMPHKMALFEHIKLLDTSAIMIGAINTLVYTDEGYKGYNTDAEGLLNALNEERIECKGKNVAIIGSGGAAYAAYVAVKEAKSIHLFNRSVENAEKLISHMQKQLPVPSFAHSLEEEPEVSFDLVIQTTGLGMGELKGQMPVCTPFLLKEAKAAVDLIYNPKETAFLKYAREKGIQCMNGFGMLYYQAVKAFELMHGISCRDREITLIKREIEKLLEV